YDTTGADGDIGPERSPSRSVDDHPTPDGNFGIHTPFIPPVRSSDMRLHGMEVVPLIDGEIRVSVDDVVGKGSDRADWDEVLPGHVADDGMMTVPLGGFLVRGIGDRIVLIDAGV